MPIKVFLKGVSKALEFPESTKMEAIEKVIGSWDNVADVKDLPMDTASRMDRARYLGFDPDSVMTHGSPEKRLEEIKKKGLFDGIFASPGESSEYGGKFQHSFIPRAGKVAGSGDLDLDYQGAIDALKREFPGESDEFYDEIYDAVAEDRFDPWSSNILEAHGFDDPGEASWEAQRLRGRIAADQGYDAIAMSDEFGESYLLPAGSRARRVDATFNPAKKESSNLLASLAGGAVGAGALSANDVEAATNKLLELGKIKQESRAYNIPHPTLNKLGLFLQRGPQSFFTEGVGRGLETLSYGRQNELTDEERRRRAIAVGLDFL